MQSLSPILLRRALYQATRLDFSSFVARCFATLNPQTRYQHNWHIDLICKTLEACSRGELTRVIFNLPPRSLKSLCISVAWPAWLLGHKPSSRIIVTSYASGLSIKHSLDCRTIMQTDWYQQLFPDTQLARDQNEKHKFMTTCQGFRLATSVGGTLTGEGGNILIIDDPLSPLQALSDTERKGANQWFDTTLASRLDDKNTGCMVLVMQRLHEEDLTGHLLAKGGWHHISIPAEFTDACQYSIAAKNYTVIAGSLLHPDRENRQLLARARQELGSHAYSAQYLQSPLPQEGGMVRPWWLKRYDVVPENATRITQSWDTAHKASVTNDASVCLTIAEAQGMHYVLDAQVMRLEYPELKRAFYDAANRWQPHAILIEDKASGQVLLQDARRESALPVIAIHPSLDKISRFAAVTAYIESGRLYLPRTAPWLATLEAEILQFPAGRHDDQVDALSQYFGWVRRQCHLSPQIRNF